MSVLRHRLIHQPGCGPAGRIPPTNPDSHFPVQSSYGGRSRLAHASDPSRRQDSQDVIQGDRQRWMRHLQRGDLVFEALKMRFRSMCAAWVPWSKRSMSPTNAPSRVRVGASSPSSRSISSRSLSMAFCRRSSSMFDIGKSPFDQLKASRRPESGKTTASNRRVPLVMHPSLSPMELSGRLSRFGERDGS